MPSHSRNVRLCEISIPLFGSFIIAVSLNSDIGLQRAMIDIIKNSTYNGRQFRALCMEEKLIIQVKKCKNP